MFEANLFKKNNVEEVPNNPLESESGELAIEKEIENEILSLESNLEGFKQEIENIGGQDALQEELDKNELLANKWKNRYDRTKMLISSVILGLSTSAIGFADSQILPQINWDLPDDQTMGQYLTAMTIIGTIGAITTFVEFIKNQKIVNATNKLSNS